MPFNLPQSLRSGWESMDPAARRATIGAAIGSAAGGLGGAVLSPQRKGRGALRGALLGLAGGGVAGAAIDPKFLEQIKSVFRAKGQPKPPAPPAAPEAGPSVAGMLLHAPEALSGGGSGTLEQQEQLVNKWTPRMIQGATAAGALPSAYASRQLYRNLRPGGRLGAAAAATLPPIIAGGTGMIGYLAAQPGG